ncbi:serine/arginine-rich splicing factor SC35-like [Camellia sinensis]|uniref:serine/arginine-rich splicing factor SC35-like n=1 Tax=Camellia sinensis TaxID=4442 RepID=UPI0010369C34|nr:serine/arginine-rich splicing factor SC35-like [Camellia sinensis]XP_028122203.1 serine/arginine-rich splicing factor SC35-like [Camellia sinensis]
MVKLSDGGWQPVIRRHGGRQVWNSWTNGSIHSVFVDNLPETMRAKGLYSIFSNYGVVVDTFIPNKLRKMTRSRFGFVRYSCPVGPDMAIHKANGLWCDDKALKVKKADYSKEDGTK